MYYLGSKIEYFHNVKMLCGDQITKWGSEMLQNNDYMGALFSIPINWRDTYAAGNCWIDVVFMTKSWWQVVFVIYMPIFTATLVSVLISFPR